VEQLCLDLAFKKLFMKKFAFVLFAALALGACTPQEVNLGDDPMAATKERVSSFMEPSLWNMPQSIDGGEGVRFALPAELTYAGGGDTDTSSSSWVTDGVESYFTLTSFVLQKCPADDSGCGLGDTVPATPKEVFEELVNSQELNCTDKGDIPLGNTTGRMFSCDSPANDMVFFYGTKGAYRVTNDLRLLLGDEALYAPLFQNFLGTFIVD